MNNFRVCQYTATDSLVELQRECLPSDQPVEYDPRNLYWVARDPTGAPVSFIIMYQYTNCWYLSRAGTLPESQGQHLYPRLLRSAFTAMRKAGMMLCVTDCAHWNIRSANGLIRAGFKLYEPPEKWGFSTGLYWRKEL